MFFSECYRLLCCARQDGPGPGAVGDGWPGAWTYTWTHADAAAGPVPGPTPSPAAGPTQHWDRSPDETNHRSRQEVLARV
jgi:hypothetical protein